MKRFSRTLVLYVYIFTTLLSMAGGTGIGTSSIVSFKPRGLDPKAHYFTSAKIPKHISPVSHSTIDIHDVWEIVDINNVPGFEEIVLPEATGNYSAPSVQLPRTRLHPPYNSLTLFNHSCSKCRCRFVFNTIVVLCLYLLN
ncbi:MAG: hypothetical protein IPN18_04390 [Ignavibacteriales bacterium]|nr:hypothetical protein [Ignavibacteriales bacterium]